MPAVRFLPVLAFVCLSSLAAAQSEWESSIVYEGDNGRLVYVTDAEGNRIPDFSHAGYRGGGVPLPDVGTRFTLSPGDGDDTARIQTLLDFLGTQSPNADGFRGALELSAGEYQIDGTLVLRRSGVVLRGAGDGDDPATNTILRRSGTRADPVVLLGPVAEAGTGTLTRRDATRDTSLIRDDVVPIGARSFEIERPEVFSVGDAVTVFHPATKTWLAAIDGGGTAEDAPWGVGQHPIALARTVTGLDGHRMTLDAPTFTRLDAHLSPSYVYHRDRSRTIENVGVENLRVHIETAGPTSETHAKDAIRFVLVENGWASGVTALHFWRAGISVQHSRYVTVAARAALEPHSPVTGARRYNFEVSQSQLVLFIGNRATDARHAYVGNGTSYDSGIVFLDNVSEDAFTSSESHRQWGSGFLWDRHVERGTSGSGSGVAARRLHIGNRGDFGTSHGWACANCVIWNAEMNGSSA
ncbi:MAG: peptidoglycan-binding protein, partial [Bacteroidota bacterium]